MRTVLFLLCMLGVAEALAQAPAAEDAPTALPVMGAFGVEMGKPLQVMRGEQRLEGRLVDVDERSFTLLDPDNSKPERVFFTDVRQLSVLESSPGRGALVGGGVGFLTGVVVATYFMAIGEDGSFLESVAIGSMMGAACSLPGAALGALIGLAVPHWARVYERKPLPETRGPLGPPVSRPSWRGKGALITFDVASLFLR